MLFAKLHIKIKTILIMQSIAMLSGMTTHLIWIINNGFLSENYNAPFFTRFFWDSLTFIDPIAAILLIIKPKTGIWLTFVIIIVDVFHNFILCFRSMIPNSNYFSYWIIGNWMFMCQIFFLVFVSVTFKSNLKEVKIRSAES
ncbi:hypothetical protein SAMN02787100_3043 [Chryseobacterium sp. OV279]|nr:hypothetical protein SAMN02787100_3043 [Chryseobacterium sp. OV279]